MAHAGGVELPTESESAAAGMVLSPTHGRRQQLQSFAPLPAQEFQEVLDEKGKSHLNLVVCGHVDAGKSTIMGHILVALELVSKKVMHKYEKESREKGKASFHFAWVLDEQEEERERGITMDVGVTHFATQTKEVTLLDAPGHRDFVSNMITGAVQADAAILVINASPGEFEAGFEQGGQTKEHVLLLKSVGVREVLVAVNKMDMCAYSEERFVAVVEQLKPFLKQAGFRDADFRFCPVAGLAGENLNKRENPELCKWYSGPTLLEAIDSLQPPVRLVNYPLRLCISDVFKSTTTGITIGGKIETGKIAVNEKIQIMPLNETYTVKAIERGSETVKEALAGDNVEIGLQGVADIAVLSVGQVGCTPGLVPPKVCARFVGQIICFKPTRPITQGYNAIVHAHNVVVEAVVTKLINILDKTGKPAPGRPKCVLKGQSATIEITAARPFCAELFSEFRSLGRFMLREGGETVAAGIIKAVLV
eukprot:TRINITY_DN6167_c0_g1_i1.p1 TRINITY_DN6167_c0_g1~~TRINITY_DN6167_c0_g1_i1.p1  ORF type:complete len:479 (-),score=127.90 TRINITY_DN6167_c0_g1_i1:132-1568(-)